jgi:hypothetical protein
MTTNNTIYKELARLEGERDALRREVAAVAQEMRAWVRCDRDIKAHPCDGYREMTPSTGLCEVCEWSEATHDVWAWADRLSAASSSPGEPTMTVRVIRDGKAEDVTFQRTLPDPPCPLCGSSSSPGETRARVEYPPHADCPRCHGTGECPNAQFSCICRWHRTDCRFRKDTRQACHCDGPPASPHGPSSGKGWQQVFANVTRLEVIDEHGRAFTRWFCVIEPSLQDGGRTLKLFVMPLPAPPQESPKE